MNARTHNTLRQPGASVPGPAFYGTRGRGFIAEVAHLPIRALLARIVALQAAPFAAALAVATLVAFAGLLAQAGFPLPAEAGVIHEDLVRSMAHAQAGSTVTGIVMFAEQPDAARLEAEMDRLGITSRWARHAYVVRHAQEIAARTQEGALRDVAADKSLGAVTAVRSYWITNAVALEAAPAVFASLSQRGDVGMIYPGYGLRLKEGWDDPPSPGASAANVFDKTLPDGLSVIRVQSAWDRGYNGAGTLVCDFDTGADVTHPALAASWRGNQPGVPAAAAWFDPYGQTTIPYDSRTHGTHTLGTMVATPPTGDPIGVAPGAQWIAAGALIGWDLDKILACFQWAIDPDGNPDTIEDVPDVVNHSWGTSADCDPTFWNSIDLLEAAGIVNIISVDNSGPGAGTVNSPESRADSPYVNFSVGNVDPHQAATPISSTSGRGPSPCDGVSIKPEVSAPGVQILSTVPGGGYASKTGTSMAAPHVSAAVAILRQVNPALTVTQAKQALMNTAQDRGIPGEDNSYGWGLIDIGAAVDYVLVHFPPSPSPTALAASLEGGSSVRLNWTAPTQVAPANPLTGYRVYRASGSAAYPTSPAIQLPAGAATWLDANRAAGTWRYRVTATYANGTESQPSNEAVITVSDVAGAGDVAGPDRGSLVLADPNPFTAATVLRPGHAVAGEVRFEIYDAAGRVLRSLTDATGTGLSWDGRDETNRPVPPGIYFVRAWTGSSRWTGRVVRVR